jgi:hypothetical protein
MYNNKTGKGSAKANRKVNQQAMMMVMINGGGGRTLFACVMILLFGPLSISLSLPLPRSLLTVNFFSCHARTHTLRPILQITSAPQSLFRDKYHTTSGGHTPPSQTQRHTRREARPRRAHSHHHPQNPPLPILSLVSAILSLSPFFKNGKIILSHPSCHSRESPPFSLPFSFIRRPPRAPS